MRRSAILICGLVAAAALLLIRVGWVPLALALVSLHWFLGLRRPLTLTGYLEATGPLVTALSLVALMALITRWPVQIVAAAVLVAAVSWQRRTTSGTAPLVAGLSQFLALWAIFLGGALQHWPVIVITGLTWAVSLALAVAFMRGRGDRASRVLTLAWALVAAEMAWVLAVWLVNYVLPGGFVIIPQAALVITAIGYCFGSIYLAHLSNQLSRKRLIEYLIIGLSVLLVVIAGTKWNATI